MPVSLGRILGQEGARQRLEAMLSRGRLAHALLFVGPEGIGKYSTALALAQVLLCRDPPSLLSACDLCPACYKTKGLAHPDLHQVSSDAATLKIDEIRETVRALQLRPLEGKVKVVILADAERLTLPAQNALLKTLEEPPGAAHLILTSSRPHLLLPTVVSRAQQVPFGHLAPALIAAHLVEVAARDPEEADVAAAMAQGSLSRALALDLAAVRERRDRAAAVDLRLELGKRNVAFEALEVAAELAEERSTLSETTDLLLAWMRDQLLLATGASGAQVVNADCLSQLGSLASTRGLHLVLRRTEVVMHARRQLDLPYNLNAQMIAEQLCLGLAGLLQPKPAAQTA